MKQWLYGIGAAIVAGLAVAFRVVLWQRDSARDERDQAKRDREAVKRKRNREYAIREQQTQARNEADKHDEAKRKSRRAGEPVGGNANDRLRGEN